MKKTTVLKLPPSTTYPMVSYDGTRCSLALPRLLWSCTRRGRLPKLRARVVQPPVRRSKLRRRGRQWKARRVRLEALLDVAQGLADCHRYTSGWACTTEKAEIICLCTSIDRRLVDAQCTEKGYKGATAQGAHVFLGWLGVGRIFDQRHDGMSSLVKDYQCRSWRGRQAPSSY